MKKIIVAAVMSLPLFLVSCTREGTALFKGNYSFKTSGNVSVTRDEAFRNDTTFNRRIVIPEGSYLPVEVVDTVVTVHDDTLKLMIDTEAGQMDITGMGAGSDDMLITMNVTAGEMVAYYAEAGTDVMSVRPSKRHMRLVSGLRSILGGPEAEGLDGVTVMADIEVSGSGRKYDNIVIFDLDYAGDFTVDGILYHITDSDIICRARENER